MKQLTISNRVKPVYVIGGYIRIVSNETMLISDLGDPTLRYNCWKAFEHKQKYYLGNGGFLPDKFMDSYLNKLEGEIFKYSNTRFKKLTIDEVNHYCSLSYLQGELVNDMLMIARPNSLVWDGFKA